MGNLLDIQIQIEKLQKQASEIRDREFDNTVQDIREKMKAFGITVKDLQAAPAGRKGRGKAPVTTKPKAAGAKSKAAGAVVAAKYRGPNGETWSGRGRKPQWVADHLASGGSIDSLRV